MSDLFVSQDHSSDEELEDDPVVQEFPIYFSGQLEDELYLFQYPTKPSGSPLVNVDSGNVESRIKPESGIVEVELPMDTSHHFDSEKGTRWNNVTTQTFTGVLKEGQSNYMIGSFKDGSLHLSPLKSSVQLRPQFRYFDKHISIEKEVQKALRIDTTKSKEVKPIHMTAKSSSEFAPKFSGAIASRKRADEEPFSSYEWNDMTSPESWNVAEKLFAKSKSQLESDLTPEQYLEAIRGNPP